MGQYRDAMARELALRGYAPRTQSAYLLRMRRLVRHFGRSPDQLSEDDVMEYFRSLASSGTSTSTFNQSLSAARIFFGGVLKRDWKVNRLNYHKAPRRLPEVLNREEVRRLLDAAESLRERALYQIAYGAGLRIDEAIRLRVGDIDSSRMLIRVHRGKGNKDRYVPLPATVLDTLRDYYRQARPKHFLFPSPKKPDQPIHVTSIQRAIQLALRRAQIEKRATYHTLRHSFATHQLEAGVKPHVLRELLGHRSLATTERYVHVAGDYLKATPNPLDSLLQATPQKRPRRNRVKK
jgi:integrase/recombinase XerD